MILPGVPRHVKALGDNLNRRPMKVLHPTPSERDNAMRVERVYLIRHGQTEWNASGRWQGFEDTTLDQAGLAQANRLANYLSERPIRAIYSSDLQRAALTAQQVAQALNADIRYDSRLRELNVGLFQGLTLAEMQARYPAEYAAMNADHMHFVMPQGESRQQLQERAYAAWQEIVENTAGPEIALVSHGGTIKMLLMRLFASDSPAISRVRLENTSITTVERTGDWWRITGLAATPHLNGDGMVTSTDGEGLQ